MGSIITPENIRAEQCQKELMEVLMKHGFVLEPIVNISKSKGIQVAVNLISVSQGGEVSNGV